MQIVSNYKQDFETKFTISDGRMNGRVICSKKVVILYRFWLWLSTITHHFKEVNYAITISSFRYAHYSIQMQLWYYNNKRHIDKIILHFDIAFASFFFTNHKAAASLNHIQSHQSRLTPTHFLRVSSKSCSFLQASENRFDKQTQHDAVWRLFNVL